MGKVWTEEQRLAYYNCPQVMKRNAAYAQLKADDIKRNKYAELKHLVMAKLMPVGARVDVVSDTNKQALSAWWVEMENITGFNELEFNSTDVWYYYCKKQYYMC